MIYPWRNTFTARYEAGLCSVPDCGTGVTSLVSSKGPRSFIQGHTQSSSPSWRCGACLFVCSIGVHVSKGCLVDLGVSANRTDRDEARTAVHDGASRHEQREGSPFHASCSLCIRASVPTRQILGLPEGRSSKKWQDYSLDGHQIVCHLVSSDYRWALCFPICCWR